MKTKNLIIACLITFIMTIVSLPVHAAGITSSTLSLTPDKETYSVGDTVTFTLKLVSLTADRGINAYSGVYEYDNAKLELVKLTGASGWSMDYNTANGKFVADRNDFTGLKNVELCKLVFKAKAESTSGTEVVVKNVELANGGSAAASSPTVKAKVKITASTGKPNDKDDDKDDDKNDPEDKDDDKNKPNDKDDDKNKPDNSDDDKKKPSSDNVQTSVMNIGAYTAVAVGSLVGIIYIIRKKIA